MAYSDIIKSRDARLAQAQQLTKNYIPKRQGVPLNESEIQGMTAKQLIFDMIQSLGLEGLLGERYTDWLTDTGSSIITGLQSLQRAEYGIPEDPAGQSGILDYMRNWLTSGQGGSFSPYGNVSTGDVWSRLQKVLGDVEYYYQNKSQPGVDTQAKYRIGQQFSQQNDILPLLLAYAYRGSPFGATQVGRIQDARKTYEEMGASQLTPWIEWLLKFSGVPLQYTQYGGTPQTPSQSSAAPFSYQQRSLNQGY